MGVQTSGLILVQLSALALLLALLASLSPDRLARWPVRGALLGAGAALSALVFAESDPHGSAKFRDFSAAYYPAGQAAPMGREAVADLLGNGVSGFVNIPVIAYLFVPFGALAPTAALVLFTALGIAACVAAWWLLVQLADIRGAGRWQLALLFAANGPLIYSLKLGNTSHMVLLALVGGLALLRANRQAMAGALLAVAALIKLPLMVFGVYYVLRRRWWTVLGFAVTCAFAALLSLAIFGWDIHQQWFEQHVLKFSGGAVGAWNVQSPSAALYRLISGPDILFDWSPHALSTPLRLVSVAFTIAILAAAIVVCWMDSRSPSGRPSAAIGTDLIEFMLVLLIALLVSPLTWTHYYAWMLIPFAFLLGGDQLSLQRSWLIIAWSGVFLISLTAVRLPFANPTLLALYAKIGTLAVLAGGILWYTVLIRIRSKMGQPAVATLSQTRVLPSA